MRISIPQFFRFPQNLADDLDPLGESRLRAAWISIVVVFFAVICWSIIALITRQLPVVYLAMIMLSGVILGMILVRANKPQAAKLSWFTAGLATVTAAFFVAHPESRVEFMFIAVAGGPVLVFSARDERAFVMALVGIVCVVWAIADTVGHDFFGGPYLSEELSRQWRPAVYATTLLVICSEFMLIVGLMENLNAKLRESEMRAVYASRAKSSFLASMSHEIRTPMNGVMGMMDLLDQTRLTHEQRRFLATAQKSSHALLRIIDDILDVSKIEAGKLELIPEPIDFLTQMESSIEVMRGHADEHRVALRFWYDSAMPARIVTDGGRLGQVTLNLLSNAIKFSSNLSNDRRGQVTLSIRRKGKDRMEIEVRDNGIGMEADFMAEIFEPFSQSTHSRNLHYGGTGLGLTIVKQLVDTMEGLIHVDSSLGEGTTITIDLPMVAAKGSLPLPDLSGWRILGHLGSEYDREALDTYLLAMGAATDWQDNPADLRAALGTCGNGRCLVVAMPEDLDQVTGNEADAMLKDVPLLALTKRRSLPAGSVAKGVFVVQSDPILLSDFIHALHDLTDHPSSALPQNPEDKTTAPPTPSAFTQLLRERQDENGSPQPRHRILVVEDNEVNQTVLTAQLRLLGYDSDVASNGREALAAMVDGYFDLVLTDCHMPVMNGFELAQALRAREQADGLAHRPIIAITADVVQDAPKTNVDIDAWLTKPVRLADLSEALATHLGRDAADPASSQNQ